MKHLLFFSVLSVLIMSTGCDSGGTPTSFSGRFNCGIYLNAIWTPSWTLTLDDNGKYKTSRGESGQWEEDPAASFDFSFTSGNLDSWVGYLEQNGSVRLIQEENLVEDETTQLWLSQYCFLPE